jgi:L-fucose isomerase-like protein
MLTEHAQTHIPNLHPRPSAARPRVGVVGLAYPGYQLGEELCAPKFQEMQTALADEELELHPAATLAYDEATARQAGAELAAREVDCLLAVITTFVPDHFIVELLRACDKPIFLWCIEREIGCLSLVCGPLITGTLYNLEKRYALIGADIADADALAQFRTFARAALAVRLLRTLRVGYVGGPCPIMLNMAVDEEALTRQLGVTVVPLPMDAFRRRAEAISPEDAAAYWGVTCRCAGQLDVQEADGLTSSRYALAALRLAEEHHLDALSLNCFPHLKSQVCLAVARLNDAGIAAACEGDLHSTILMALLQRLSGRAAFNGDLLRQYPEDNSILFSHCGAGAFSLAASPCDICLHASIETLDGLAVQYATHLPGPVTLANLMHGPGGLRLAVMAGEGVETDLAYEGTPLRVRFPDDVKTIVQRVARCGAGHHWNGGAGHLAGELRRLCEWLRIAYTELT